MTENITNAVVTLIDSGWHIDRCSCACGGNFAWSRPRLSGASEMRGCVCHTDPVALLAELRDAFRPETRGQMHGGRE